MPKISKRVGSRSKLKKHTMRLWTPLWNYAWRGPLHRKILTVVGIIIGVSICFMYGIGQWYVNKHKNEPLVLGTTFISDYAESFGLEPKSTLEAILKDLDVKQIRLVSYWKHIEKDPGVYDFSELDWQFAMANKYGTKVTLAVGMRQPRWPECHDPDWARAMPKKEWEPKLHQFITATVDRYKNNPALSSYQLENEFFMKVFGDCPDFDRERLVREFNLVKSQDPTHTVIISRSNNWVGIPVGRPTPDQFGISVYKRVWDATITKRYFEYPLPAEFYSFLAGAGEIVTGKSMVIHELQSEPWIPSGNLSDGDLKEQYKSMNAMRFADRISYAKDTGVRNIDLWGAEWWYWLKTKKGDPSVWNVAKEAISQAEAENRELLNRQ